MNWLPFRRGAVVETRLGVDEGGRGFELYSEVDRQRGDAVRTHRRSLGRFDSPQEAEVELGAALRTLRGGPRC